MMKKGSGSRGTSKSVKQSYSFANNQQTGSSSSNSSSQPFYLLSSFDVPRCENFACVTLALESQRISVWETRSQSLIITWQPSSNSSSSSTQKNTKFTSLTWGNHDINATTTTTNNTASDVALTNGNHIMLMSNGGEDGQESLAGQDSKKRRKDQGKQGSGPSSGRVVVAGTSVGEILIFSIAQGKLAHTLTVPGTPSAVVDFVFSTANPHTAFSLSASGDIVHWDLQSLSPLGKFKVDVHGFTRLALHDDRQQQTASSSGASASAAKLAVAGHQVKLVDVAALVKQKYSPTSIKPREFIGHATPVLDLKFACHGSYCVSAASQDRFLSVWNCANDASTNAAAVLTLDSPPIQLSVSAQSHLLAVNEMGIVNIWPSLSSLNDKHDSQPTPKKAKVKPVSTLPPQSTVRVKILSEADGVPANDAPSTVAPILAAAFSSDNMMVVAYGKTVKPTFERVKVLNDQGKLAEENFELVRVESAGMLMDAKQFADKKLSANKVAYSESRNATLLSGNTIHQEDPDLAESVLKSKQSTEMTISERLTQMALADPSTAPAATRTPTHLHTTSSSSGPSSKQFKPPTAASLHAMLSQAIHSGDKQLLERSLQVHDPTMISATVARLPPTQVLEFVQMLVSRLQARPNRAPVLVEWVRAVVVAHAAYLMSNPSVVKQLSALYQTLDARVSTFQKFLKLSGRLDLVMAQINMRSTANNADGEDPPEATYDEENEVEDDLDEDEGDDDDDDDDDDEEDEDLNSDDEYWNSDEYDEDDEIDEDDDDEEEDVDEFDEFDEDQDGKDDDDEEMDEVADDASRFIPRRKK